MKLKKALKSVTLAVLIVVSAGLSGCAGNNVILNPIDKEDIFAMEEGETYTAPRSGWFLSDMYVEEIAQIKIEK